MSPTTLVFATHNKNKLSEVKALMPKSIRLLSLTDINCHEDIPETHSTIEGNAKQKAIYIKQHYGYDCFADDTGLEVDALDGAPGVFSARYAGPDRDADANMQKVLDGLKNKVDRSAQFKTVIALFFNGSYYEFPGICEGQITTSKQGQHGFGYDPIFQPKGYHQTFAEMNLNLKNKIGHRGKAIQKLITYLKKIQPVE